MDKDWKGDDTSLLDSFIQQEGTTQKNKVNDIIWEGGICSTRSLDLEETY